MKQGLSMKKLLLQLACIELLKQDDRTIDMSDYSNFEKVGELPESLPTNDEQIDTDFGDLILYLGHRFVIYYVTKEQVLCFVYTFCH